MRRGGRLTRRTRLRRTGQLARARRPIRQVSAKRELVNDQRRQILDVYRGGPCRLATPACTRRVEGLHELVGRAQAGALLDRRNLVPACNACNRWVESFPTRARVDFDAPLKVDLAASVWTPGGHIPRELHPLSIAHIEQEEWT